MRKIFASLAVASFVFAAGVGAAQADGPNPVKYRQGVFQAVAWNFGPLVGMVKGKMDFNADMVKANAENLVALGKMMPGGFMAKGADKGEKTSAKAAIWEDMDGFKAAYQKYVDAAANLAATGAESKESLGKAVAQLGASCKACHKDYKEN